MAAHRVDSFPSARLRARDGGAAVEVHLIAQLGHGAGDQLHASVRRRQAAHARFVDALDEPSAQLGAPAVAQGDASALYSFLVGGNGHPFHRHAGARMFTAVAGSGGAMLRFSTMSREQAERDPRAFVDSLRCVAVPPDGLFTVRFSPGVWHQFAPWKGQGLHPALMALSCHANELDGDLAPELRERVRSGQSSIAALTEVLPEATARRVAERLRAGPDPSAIELSLDAPPGTLHRLACAAARCATGLVRGRYARIMPLHGFQSLSDTYPPIHADAPPAPGSMLLKQFSTDGWHHQDHYRIVVPDTHAGHADAASLLGRLLQAFLDHPPRGVGRLMRLRNTLVRPWRLQTSTLGCPVASLKGAQRDRLFLDRFPVLDQQVAADGSRAQVILGVDDRHLRFRSCIDLQCRDGRIEIAFGTRVHCRNRFGRFYLAAIDGVHRHYVAPRMLREAVGRAFALDAGVGEADAGGWARAGDAALRAWL